MIREREIRPLSGVFMLFILVAIGLVLPGLLIGAARADQGWAAAGFGLAWVIDLLSLAGLFVVNPNEAKVVQLFGSYVGTVREPGFKWVNPFCTKRKVSQRVRNFETPKLKVNDHVGNPIEIAAVVVWKVTDTAEAVFEVDNYENFVHVQSESALRNLATSYPYDAHTEGEMALRSNTAEIAGELMKEIHATVDEGGHRRGRSAHQPPGVRARNRRRDAAPPAGQRDRRRAAEVRRGRGGDGGDGARPAGKEERRDARRRAQGGHGEQHAGGVVQRPAHPAGHQYRHPLPVSA
jgi:regulator of protease activity HflC (stomatin/prohibitin superfamily)